MGMQCVEMLFDAPVTLDCHEITEMARQIVGADIEPGHFGESGLILFHREHLIEYSDGAAPVQTAILAASEPSSPESYTDEVNQSWRCENSQELIAKTNRSVLVTEMMASLAEPEVRLQLFHGVLEAAIRVTRPVALVFKSTQQIIDPAVYLASLDAPYIERPGSLNVRFFQITDRPGEMLMDLLGLETIGLHDLQCHFGGLSPDDVSHQLYGLALYLLENGPVIESGHTIEGITPGSKWQCQFENSLLPPEREVLDLNPGAPYAAGNRE